MLKRQLEGVQKELKHAHHVIDGLRGEHSAMQKELEMLRAAQTDAEWKLKDLQEALQRQASDYASLGTRNAVMQKELEIVRAALAEAERKLEGAIERGETESKGHAAAVEALRQELAASKAALERAAAEGEAARSEFALAQVWDVSFGCCMLHTMLSNRGVPISSRHCAFTHKYPVFFYPMQGSATAIGGHTPPRHQCSTRGQLSKNWSSLGT